jgi:hypothetical protein
LKNSSPSFLAPSFDMPKEPKSSDLNSSNAPPTK